MTGDSCRVGLAEEDAVEVQIQPDQAFARRESSASRLSLVTDLPINLRMAVPWHDYEYPATKSEERLSKGIDRCQSPGIHRVNRLEAMVVGGLIVDPGTRAPLTTPGPGSAGRWIFAVREGRMRLAPDGGSRWFSGGLPPDAIKHETLFSNASVTAAGEIFITEGMVVEVNPISGSYTCDMDEQFVGAVLEAIRNAGAVVTDELRRRLA